jgi:hypothetical protein
MTLDNLIHAATLVNALDAHAYLEDQCTDPARLRALIHDMRLTADQPTISWQIDLAAEADGFLHDLKTLTQYLYPGSHLQARMLTPVKYNVIVTR